jgi:hypothetical protein
MAGARELVSIGIIKINDTATLISQIKAKEDRVTE